MGKDGWFVGITIDRYFPFGWNTFRVCVGPSTNYLCLCSRGRFFCARHFPLGQVRSVPSPVLWVSQSIGPPLAVLGLCFPRSAGSGYSKGLVPHIYILPLWVWSVGDGYVRPREILKAVPIFSADLFQWNLPCCTKLPTEVCIRSRNTLGWTPIWASRVDSSTCRP